MKTRILIIAATQKELQAVDISSFVNTFDIQGLVTGIGSMLTAYSLMSYMKKKTDIDYIINIGIAGSFTTELSIGDSLLVGSDRFADLGFEQKNGFSSVWEAGLMDPSEFPFENGIINCDKNVHSVYKGDFRFVKGITVNSASGNNETIERLRSRYDPDIETMEVAAAIYIGAKEEIPVIALRTISNFIEPRNRDAWDIQSALSSLNPAIKKILTKIDSV